MDGHLPPKEKAAEPLQLIEFVRDDNAGNTTIKLNYETIDRVFKPVGDRKISIICVCGPSRQGKSFLLGYMIRCLEGMEVCAEDWMDWSNSKKPLKGFKFRNGTSPETQGIWIWSKPFIVKDEETNEEIAVILVDTQGTYDEFTTNKDMSAIVGLSLLFSSVMIFNFFTNLQEDVLLALNTYIQYGTLALDNAEDSGTPFQKLCFLIRDWNNPGECPFGEKGGKKFLDKKLQVKDGQPPEAKHVRETIRKCFQDLECFLMPQIGEKALYPEFTGSISELSKAFAKKLEEFVNQMASTENLVAKEIMGTPVTASELKSFLESYMEIYNSAEVPSAEDMWQATSKMCNINAVEKAMQKYRQLMKSKARGTSYLSEENLEKLHSAVVKQAEGVFKQARKFGTPETITEFLKNLEKEIKQEFLKLKKENEERRQRFITASTEDARSSYREMMKIEFPFEDIQGMEFFEESKVHELAHQEKSRVINEFEEKLSNESGDKLATVTKTLEEMLDAIRDSLINQNKLNRANAEKHMVLIVEELISSHSSKINEYLEENKYEDDEKLEQGYDQVKSATLKLYQDQKKTGSKRFQKEYLEKLEKEIEKTFLNLKNEHKLKLQEMLKDAEKCLKDYVGEYERELMERTKNENEQMSVEGLIELHSERVVSILKKFNENSNPFPAGSGIATELENKLILQLQQVCDKIKMEVVESRQLCEESYRKAIEHALNHYKSEMIDILESDNLMEDEDLQEEHQRIFESSLVEYECHQKIGIHDDALKIKYELRSKLDDTYDELKRNHEQNRELLKSKAKICQSDCLTEYDQIMKTKIESLRTGEELREVHEKAKSAAVDKLRRNCPVRDPSLLAEHENVLDAEIDSNFEQVLEIFKLIRSEEETATRALLIDVRKFYHDEMGKHHKNDLFMNPAQLNSHHEDTKKAIFAKIEKKTHLSSLQREDLEKVMDELVEIYHERNDMNLNSGELGVAPAIGIDLGTTYCCIGVYYRGDVIIIPNQDQGGNLTTPSYVAFEPDGSEVVGKPAKDNAYKNPENTIYDAKRIIGRKITDGVLQEDMKFWPFEVREDEGVPKVVVDGRFFHPEEISARLLVQSRVMVEQYLKLKPGTITKAVITVPAYFNDGQREATVHAGRIAGLDVLTILNEPTAAAIAYAKKRLDREPRKILIYDLGGGTFDVAVLDMKHKDIEVLGVNGDTHLGGEDFDKRMMELCAEAFKNEFGIDLFSGKDSGAKTERDDARRRLRRLQTYCENAKRDLAAAKTTKVSVDAIINGLDLSVDITREKFEELNDDYFKKSLDLVSQTLLEVNLRKEEIDDIVLVGGSSRILKVQEMLGAYFGKALNKSIHPDHAVAYGAAVQAALMNGEQAKGQIDFSKIQDVTPMSLGIEIHTKELSVILPKNSKVPIKKTEVYRTAKDNQTSIYVQIYQGEDFDVAANNKLLGTFTLEGIPSAKAGAEPVDVSMEINSMGILHVEATCRSTRGKNSITVHENKQRMSEETIKKLQLSDGA